VNQGFKPGMMLLAIRQPAPYKRDMISLLQLKLFCKSWLRGNDGRYH